MSYEKYGLTAVDASGADLDKGIVAGPNGKYYQIDDFKHGQEDGLDKDGGAAFSSSLAADAKAAGFDPSNFNTAGDVQNAINAIGGGAEPVVEGPAWDDAKNGKPLSDEIASAKERAKAWTESNGGGDIYGTGVKARPGDVDYSEIENNAASMQSRVQPKKKPVK